MAPSKPFKSTMSTMSAIPLALHAQTKQPPRFPARTTRLNQRASKALGSVRSGIPEKQRVPHEIDINLARALLSPPKFAIEAAIFPQFVNIHCTRRSFGVGILGRPDHVGRNLSIF
jgi:hypothetical protein